MKKITELFRSSPFLRHNAIFFIGSMVVAFLNYLYYPVLGRLLEPSTFGEVQLLVSIFLQAGIFLSVLGIVTVNIVANTADEKQSNHLVLELEKFALGIAFAVLIFGALFSKQLQEFLNFSSVWPFLSLGLAIAIGVPISLRSAYLRANQKFASASTLQIIASGAKLVLSAVLVYVGLSTFGAITGLLIAHLITFVYTARLAVRAGWLRRGRKLYASLPDFKLIKPELAYGGLVLLVSLSLVMQLSMDMVIVKHYFPPVEAGLYAGIVTAARVIFFATGSLVPVLLPYVRTANSYRENRKFLLGSAAMLFLVGGSALVLFTWQPELVLRLLLGEEYLKYANLLPLLSLAIFIASVNNLIYSYYMALRCKIIAVFAVVGTIATGLLLYLNHETLSQVIYGLLYGGLIMMGLVLAWIVTNQLKYRLKDFVNE